MDKGEQGVVKDADLGAAAGRAAESSTTHDKSMRDPQDVSSISVRVPANGGLMMTVEELRTAYLREQRLHRLAQDKILTLEAQLASARLQLERSRGFTAVQSRRRSVALKRVFSGLHTSENQSTKLDNSSGSGVGGDDDGGGGRGDDDGRGNDFSGSAESPPLAPQGSGESDSPLQTLEAETKSKKSSSPQLHRTNMQLSDEEQRKQRTGVLASYVPDCVLQVLSETSQNKSIAESSLQRPNSRRVRCAAVLADISGFTSLTERLAKLHNADQGAEILSESLNSYFGRMIDIIYENGGDVIKFAGDALILTWTTAADVSTEPVSVDFADGSSCTMKPLGDCVLRSLQCCLDLIAALDQFEGLRLHIGIGAGAALIINVGGPMNRYECLVAGEALVEMSHSEAFAQPGEVCIGPGAYDVVADHVRVGPRGSLSSEDGSTFHTVGSMHRRLRRRPSFRRSLLSAGHAQKEMLWMDEDMEAYLLGYVPVLVRERVNTGGVALVDGLCRVSVLFVNLAQIDYSRSDVLDHLNMVMVTMQNQLYRHGGLLRQFIMDDKGTTLIAVFGLRAQDNDQLEAIRCSISIRSALEKIGTQCRIGVTSGDVFAGAVGNSFRCEYAVIGDVVNLSARLMVAAAKLSELAPSQLDLSILCDAETRDGAHVHVNFVPVPPVKLKGKQDPVRLFAPIGFKTFRPNLSVQLPQPTERGGHGAAYHATSGSGSRKQLQANVLKQVQSLSRSFSQSDLRVDADGPEHDSRVIFIEGADGSGKLDLINKIITSVSEKARDGADDAHSSHKAVIIQVDPSFQDASSPFGVAYMVLQQLMKIIGMSDLADSSSLDPATVHAELAHLVDTGQPPAPKLSGRKESGVRRMRLSTIGNLPQHTDRGASDELEHVQLLLSVLLPTAAFPGASSVEGSDSTDQKDIIARLLIYALRGAGLKLDGPIMLIVQNLQRMDLESQTFIHTLASKILRHQWPMILIMSATSSRSIAEIEEHQSYDVYRDEMLRLQMHGLQAIDLPPLSDTETLALACSHAGVERVSDELQQFLYDFSQGQAQMVIDVLNRLLENGQVVSDGGTLKCPGGVGELQKSTAALPRTVQGFLRSRMEAIDSSLQMLLKVISIAPTSISLHLLEQLVDVDTEEEKKRFRKSARRHVTSHSSPIKRSTSSRHRLSYINAMDEITAYVDHVDRQGALQSSLRHLKPQLHIMLDQLVAMGFLNRSRRLAPRAETAGVRAASTASSTIILSFIQPSMHLVAYKSLLFSQRRYLHLRCAALINQELQARLGPKGKFKNQSEYKLEVAFRHSQLIHIYRRLAHHWSRASESTQDIETAIDFCLNIWKIAWGTHDYAAAIMALENALRYSEHGKALLEQTTRAPAVNKPAETTSPQRDGVWLRQIGDAQIKLGRYTDACKSYLRALESQGALRSTSKGLVPSNLTFLGKSKSSTNMSKDYCKSVDRLMSSSLLQRPMKDREASAMRALECARALFAHSLAELDMQRDTSAHWQVLFAAQVALEAGGPSTVFATTLAELAVLTIGSRKTCDRCADVAAEIVRKGGNPEAIAFVQKKLATVYFQRGDLERARDLACEAMELYTALKDHRSCLEPSLVMLRCKRLQGRLSEAVQHAQELCQQSRAHAHMNIYVECMCHLADIYLDMGDSLLSLEELDKIQRALVKHSNNSELFVSTNVWGGSLLTKFALLQSRLVKPQLLATSRAALRLQTSAADAFAAASVLLNALAVHIEILHSDVLNQSLPSKSVRQRAITRMQSMASILSSPKSRSIDTVSPTSENGDPGLNQSRLVTRMKSMASILSSPRSRSTDAVVSTSKSNDSDSDVWTPVAHETKTPSLSSVSATTATEDPDMYDALRMSFQELRRKQTARSRSLEAASQTIPTQNATERRLFVLGWTAGALPHNVSQGAMIELPSTQNVQLIREMFSHLREVERSCPLVQPMVQYMLGNYAVAKGKITKALKAWTRALHLATDMGLLCVVPWITYQIARYTPLNKRASTEGEARRNNQLEVVLDSAEDCEMLLLHRLARMERTIDMRLPASDFFKGPAFEQLPSLLSVFLQGSEDNSDDDDDDEASLATCGYLVGEIFEQTTSIKQQAFTNPLQDSVESIPGSTNSELAVTRPKHKRVWSV